MMRKVKFKTLCLAASALCSAQSGQAANPAGADQWGLTDSEWKSGTDLELARQSEILMRCDMVKAVNERSDARSQLMLAIAYRHGICVEENGTTAAKWVELAAKQNDARAVLEQASIIAENARSTDDLRTALALIQRAADAGDFRAKAALALAYLEGIKGVAEMDSPKAFALMQQAIRGGYWPALAAYSSILRESDGAGVELSPSEIAAAWKRAAELGNYPAMKRYAELLEKGEGVAADPAAAAQWQQKIAAYGELATFDQAFDAARAVQIDWKVVEKLPKSMADLESAAKTGDADAMYELATRLEFGGDAVAADLGRAISLYKQAARKGHSGATNAAIVYLLAPSSPYYDEAEAVRLLRQQIQSNKANGADYRRQLAGHLAGTSSGKPDVAGAQALLREGIAAGDAYAIRDLADMLTPAEGDDDTLNALRDPQEAIKLYEKYLATPEGREDVETMALLAFLYNGNLVDNVDHDAMANFWIFKSANGGSALGNVYLGDFLFYGQAQQNPDYAKAKQYWSKALELRPDWDLSDRLAMADSALSEDRNTVTAAAMVELGQKYDDGVQRPVNRDKARYWLQRGIDAGSNDRDALWRLAIIYDDDGNLAKSEPIWRRLTSGDDYFATDARKRVAEFDAARAAARPVAKVAEVRPKPRSPSTAATTTPPPSAPSVGKAWGNQKVPTGKQLICEMQVWSTGMKSFGIVSRDKRTRYDDAFRIEFLSRTQIRITGSDYLTNGTRSIVVQGDVATISDTYSERDGMLGMKFWNVSPFSFNLGRMTFTEIWDTSWGGRTEYRGNCE